MVDHYEPTDEDTIRQTTACIADPDAPIQAKVWAAVARRYAKAAISAREAE